MMASTRTVDKRTEIQQDAAKYASLFMHAVVFSVLLSTFSYLICHEINAVTHKRNKYAWMTILKTYSISQQQKLTM